MEDSVSREKGFFTKIESGVAWKLLAFQLHRLDTRDISSPSTGRKNTSLLLFCLCVSCLPRRLRIRFFPVGGLASFLGLSPCGILPSSFSRGSLAVSQPPHPKDGRNEPLPFVKLASIFTAKQGPMIQDQSLFVAISMV